MTPDRRADAPTALGIVRDLDPYVLLALTSLGDEVEVAVRPLPHDHRCGAAMLLRLDAPPGASTVAASFVGATTSGRDHHDAREGDQEGDRKGDPDHRIDVAVDRWGTITSAVRPLGDDGTTGDVEPGSGAAPEGLVIDALHRTLGLPSPGGPPALTELVTAMWMTCVGTRLLGRPAPTWASVAELHPAVDPPPLGRPGGRSGIPPSPEALAAATRRVAADGTTWERLRLATVAGRFPAPDLTPEEAAWMDHTMYARWYVQSCPTAASVARRLRAAGAGEAASRVEHVARLLA